MRHSRHGLKKLLFLCLLFTGTRSVFSQGSSKPGVSLVTKGLQNEQLFQNILKGNFADIPFDRDEPGFSIILDVYITAYFENCGSSLPSNKVELTYQECDDELVTRNGYGAIVSRNCLHWSTIHTGEYASPAMYQAKMTVDALQKGDIFRTLIKMLKQDNPIGAEEDFVQKGLIMKQDMISLFSTNDCSSPGMKRFEENLRRFAMNLQPIVLEGSQLHSADPSILSKNQDFNKLVDDLIDDQSASWAMNKYKPHTVTNVNIISRDGLGRMVTLKADYQFQGWGGQRTGSITLTFLEGLPNCMYFFDFPTTCRTASRKIVTNYANGGYLSH